MSAEPEGTVYRARSRVALTTPGVAILGTALPLVAAVVSALVADRLTWVFGLPLVLVAVYCAWEARPDARAAAWVVPPLSALLASVVAVLIFDGYGSGRMFLVNLFRVLAGQVAPMLVLAEAGVVAVLLYRRWRDRPVTGVARP
jgi:hypothetical protein